MAERVITYSEYEYWSVTHGAHVVRLSVPDENAQEYWTIVAADGAGYRDRRNAAIDLCVEAMALGLSPGEVRAV